MAQRQQHSQAGVLTDQWLDFRAAGSLMYDVLLWQDLTWPSIALSWLPYSAWTQPPDIAAAEGAATNRRRQDFERRAAAAAAAAASSPTGPNLPPQADAGADASQDMEVDEQPPPPPAAAAGAAGGGGQGSNGHPQLVQMPVDCHYLLVGSQTSGQGAACIDLYMVELPGQLKHGLQRQQRVLMQKADMRQVMRISHGRLDVNRLAVMPQQPNIVATCCDESEVYIFDLRQHAVQEWSAQAGGGLQEASQGDDAAEGSHSSGSQASEHDADDADDADDAESASEAASASDTAGPTEPPHPQAVLTGRAAGGFGLEFNPVKQHVLLGGDSQGGVQLWDVTAVSSSSSGVPRIAPVQAEEHFAAAAINDLSWHLGGTAYALALENGQVCVQDLRAPPSNGNSSAAASSSGIRSSSSRSALGLTQFAGKGVQQQRTGSVHVKRQRKQRLAQLEQEGPQPITADCYCVAFDPSHEYRLASGGADGYVQILDLRRLDDPVEQLGMHAGSVTSVAWSHSLPGLLTSAADDGAVLLWDANRFEHAGAFSRRHVQQQQQQDQALDHHHHHHQQQQQQQGLGLRQPPKVGRQLEECRKLSLPGLLFMHGGHMGAVGGLALNPERPWLVASSTSCVVDAPDERGRSVVIQRQPVMVWEVNRSQGLLC